MAAATKTRTQEKTEGMLTINHACRACGGKELSEVLDLGVMPLANSFLDPEDAARGEPAFPLTVHACADCGLLQLIHVVAPEVLFRDYIYVSTTSDTLQRHFAELARSLKERYRLGAESLAVEIASNDGLLMKKFRDVGVRAVGVEPAVNIAALARRDGLEVVNEFFTAATARAVREQYGQADLVLGNNVLAHVNDLTDFLTGIELLLKPEGGVSIEVPYARDLIEHREYDTIYHEHLSYFSAAVLARLFARHGLEVYDVERVAIHGGSIRVHGQKRGGPRPVTDRLKKLLAEEEEMGLNTIEFQRRFARQVEHTREALVNLLADLKRQGKRVVGYGAPAKGNTQLNYCKIGTELVAYTVDKSSLKQGKLTPGMHLPVYPPEKLLQDQPDYCLIIAWNFAEEIMRQQSAYRERGGRFILPLPEARIA
jgi:SAM-dependent methyltransferase